MRGTDDRERREFPGSEFHCERTFQSGDLATSSSELAVARVRIWLAELAVPNTGLAVLLRFAHVRNAL